MSIRTRGTQSARLGRGARSRPIQIVVTPGSGHGSAMSTALELRDALSARGYRTRLTVFTDLDSVRRWAEQDPAEYSLLICVGGDGTQSATALAACRRAVPFLPVSSGFGNLFARAFNHPSTVMGVLDLLARGRVVQVDIGLRNGEPFLCEQSYGLIADVQEAVESVDAPRARWRRWLAYCRAALGHLRGAPPPRLRVSVDGRLVAADAALVTVANVKTYGDWLPLAPDASPVDGMLDVFVMQGASHRHLFGRLLRRYLRLPGSPLGALYRGRRISVSGLHASRDQLEVMPHRLAVVASPETGAGLEHDLARQGDPTRLPAPSRAA
jgi:diacylglycerol kinase (ATP)